MERIRTLVSRLQEQVDRNASPAELLITTQLLQAELNAVAHTAANSAGTSKVAVVLPIKTVHTVIASVMEEVEPASKPVPAPAAIAATAELLFDVMQEVPTLAQQSAVRELNDVMARQNGSNSLNDQLRKAAVEVADALTEAPIRDLKKAIGVNDRYVFISALFRGDETMYERSIKTINNFHIFAEAEYWIERELKLKLGWRDEDNNAHHFYQLVRRRFA